MAYMEKGLAYMSKGSAPRPLSVSKDKFDKAFDAIFNKKSDKKRHIDKKHESKKQ